MSKPRLRGIFRVVPMGTDRVQLRSGARVLSLTHDRIGEVGPDLFKAMDGHRTLAELSRCLSLPLTVLNDVVTSLEEAGVVVESGAELHDEPIGFDYYAELGQRPADVERRLATATVALVGLPPAARIAAGQLLAGSLGRLWLVDDAIMGGGDVFGTHRATSELGRRRVDVVAQDCSGRSGEVAKFKGIDSLGSQLRDVDLVVAEIDDEATSARVTTLACIAANVMLLLYSVGTIEATIGPTVVAGRTACYECLEQRRVGHVRYYDEEIAYRAALRAGQVQPRDSAPLPGVPQVVGGLLCMEAMANLVGPPSLRSDGRLLVFDARDRTVHDEFVLAVPGCAVCGFGAETEAI